MCQHNKPNSRLLRAFIAVTPIDKTAKTTEIVIRLAKHADFDLEIVGCATLSLFDFPVAGPAIGMPIAPLHSQRQFFPWEYWVLSIPYCVPNASLLFPHPVLSQCHPSPIPVEFLSNSQNSTKSEHISALNIGTYERANPDLRVFKP